MYPKSFRCIYIGTTVANDMIHDVKTNDWKIYTMLEFEKKNKRKCILGFLKTYLTRIAIVKSN